MSDELVPELGAIIVAGGKGSRMGVAGQVVPKVLHRVGRQTLLEHHLDCLQRAGVEDRRIVVATGHLHDQVAAAATHINAVRDPHPLGSGGCLGPVGPIAQSVLVILGDVYSTVDYTKLIAYHQHRGAAVTVVVHPNDHPWDSDLVAVDGDGRITELHRKPHATDSGFDNQAVAGVYVLDAVVWDFIRAGEFADLAHDIFTRVLDARLEVVAYRTVRYVKDAGTPKRLAHVQADHAEGRVARQNGLRRTAFLDRDGTLNEHRGYISAPGQIALCAGAAEAVRALNRAGVLTVVVTNQPVLARGECSSSTLDDVHAQLTWLLGLEGAYLDRIYFCPHHPDAGFPGEVPSLKGPCECRKPAPGMIERAARELPIDLQRSAMFGDTARDEGAAAAVDVPFFRVGREQTLLRQVQAWLGCDD